MNIFILTFLSVGLTGAFWRAAFVATLAITVYVLARYRMALAAYSKRTRYLSICLRGLSMLLLASALVGVTFEYQARAPVRVLIYRGHQTHDKKEAEATARVLPILKTSGVEFIEESEREVAIEPNQPDHHHAAALVVTDGAMRAADARRTIEEASAETGGGPVFVVMDIESSDGPRIAVENITAMSRAVRGVPLHLNCLLHARGMRGHATLVTISDDAQVRTSVEARWKLDDETQVVSLEVVPKVSGWINYTVRAEPAGDEDPSTLSRPFTVFAEERRQRILVLEGEPTWEAKFIRRALEKAELIDVDYFAQVSRSAITGIRVEQLSSKAEDARENQTADRGRPEARLREVLSSAVRLNVYDSIILGTTPDALLSNSEATRLRDWVERRAGGLIILGGNNFASSIVAPRGKLGSLVPAEVDSSGFRSDAQMRALSRPIDAEKSRGQFFLSATDAGQNGALSAFSIAAEGSSTKGVLSGDGLRLGRLRPGAIVLAVRGKARAQGASEDGTPLIASMRYGLGRTLVFAPSDSWRMRTTEGGDQADNNGPFSTLWQGLALWAGAGSRPPAEIVLSNDSPETGEEVTAEIRVRDETFASLPIDKLSGRLQQLSTTGDESEQAELGAREILFTPDVNDPGIWRARFLAPGVGKFDLEVKYTANGKNGEVEKYLAAVAPSSIDVGASRDTLQRVARGTGGGLFAAADLNPLTERLAALRRNNQFENRRLELRSWWPLALIIPFLFSLEWLLLRLSNRPKATSL